MLRRESDSLLVYSCFMILRSARISRKGNAYYSFTLSDEGQELHVFSFGTRDLSDGNRVRVTGTYRTEKYVSGRTFYNEIDCTDGSISTL
jgi:hypothetical protein